MRLNHLFLAATAFFALVGCTPGQPKLYRVALDRSPERNVAAPSCYRNSQLPGGKQISEVHFFEDHQWVLWDGIEGKQYLDIGAQTFQLGHAPTITVTDMIEGSDKVFSAQHSEQGPFPGVQATETRQTLVAVTFNDLGNSPTGTMLLKAEYACINGNQSCPTPNTVPDSVTCSATLNFVARLVATSQTTNYAPKGH
jgi:hypothetical protein